MKSDPCTGSHQTLVSIDTKVPIDTIVQ